MRRVTSRTAAIAGAFLLAACGPAEEGRREAGAGDRPAPGAGPAETESARGILLSEKNGSGLAGSAHLTVEDDTLSVVVEATGLTGGESYPLHVHQGSCEAGGPVAASLGRIAPGSDGAGESRARIPLSELEGASGHYVQAHLPNGVPALCGELPSVTELTGTASPSSGGE